MTDRARRAARGALDAGYFAEHRRHGVVDWASSFAGVKSIGVSVRRWQGVGGSSPCIQHQVHSSEKERIMHVTINRAARVLLSVLLAAPLLAAAQTAPAQSAGRSPTQGLKETDRFIKAGNNAHASIANARHEAKHTLDMYNKLVTQPSKNMKGDYKKLMGAVDDMKEEVADARLEITNMRANGDTYFTGRETTNKAIQDPQLQSSAATRLATSRKEFDTVLASLGEAGDALEVFRKDLTDQITFLGSDLTPTAMTALKPAADKLNKQGDEVLGKIDAANAALRAYLDGLKAAQS